MPAHVRAAGLGLVLGGLACMTIAATSAGAQQTANPKPPPMQLLEAPQLVVPPSGEAFKLRAVRAEKGLDVPGFGRVLNAYHYEVTPPGQTEPLQYPNPLIAPTFLTDRGRTLSIDLTSALAHATNLHFHGFQGSAKKIGDRFGDCVFPVVGTAPASLFGGNPAAGADSSDPCDEQQPASMRAVPPGGGLRYAYQVNSLRSGLPHPRGLYWYHAHPHGKAEGQIAGGLAGLVVVGDPRLDYREPLTGLEPQRIRVRTMGLKDMKLVRNGPSLAYRFLEFQSDAAQNTYKELACPLDDQLKPTRAESSWCRLDIKTPEDVGGAKDGRWLFTVNGMAYPRVTVASGGSEIWRIANLSADATYRLELVDDDGNRLRMQLLARSGAAPPIQDAKFRWVKEIVLMPSARVEVLLNACAARDETVTHASRCQQFRTGGGHAVLRTAGAVTGLAAEKRAAKAAGETDTAGDVWPAMPLLDVVFEGGAAPAAAATRDLPGSGAPGNARASYELMTPKLANRLPARPAELGQAARSAGCVPPADGYMSEAIRVVRLNNFTRELVKAQAKAESETEEVFGIYSDTLRVGKTTALQILETELAELPQAAYQRFRMDMPPICVRQGRHERWLVVNDSDECHNFHIHQLRFGVLGYRLDASERAALPNAHCLGTEFAGSSTGGVVLSNDVRPMHDSFPLPPQSVLLIEIDFSRPDSVGRYTFHCHIVEHEDKGMAGLVEVVRAAEGPSPAKPVKASRLKSRPLKSNGRFQLIRHDGQPFDSRTLAGRPHAIFFGYTSCPNVCPTTLLDIGNLLARLGADADRLTVLFVSVDPEHDTAEHLRSYLAAFDHRIIGLTGHPAEIISAAQTYKAFFERVPGRDELPVFNHSAGVFLVDRKGTIAAALSYQETQASQLAKLRQLLGTTPVD